MATQSKVTPTGWTQSDDSVTVSRVIPTGWEQQTAVAAPGGLSIIIAAYHYNHHLGTMQG